jgi:hypothetical protein
MFNPLERHFSVSELAEIWHLSSDKIRKLFKERDGVLVISEPKRGHRPYKTLRIPESVATRVYQQLLRGGR